MELFVKVTAWKNVQIQSFFCFVFSCIRTEYWDLLCKSPYSVRIQKNTDQKKLAFGHFSRSDKESKSKYKQEDKQNDEKCRQYKPWSETALGINSFLSRYLNPYFNISTPLLCCRLFLQKISQALGQNQQNGKWREYLVRRSLSRLTLGLHPFIILYTPIHFVDFFSQNCMYYTTWLEEIFKFMVFRLLENGFSKYKNCIHHKYKKYTLLLIPQGNLSPSFSSIPPRLREFISKLRFFENLPQAERGKSST